MGKKRLERAIEQYKKTVPGGADDSFTVTWYPSYLDASLPKTGGIDRYEYLVKKYGPERAKMITVRLQNVGAAEGIKFKHDKIGNTRDAHRLVQLAKTKSNEIENKLEASLFKAVHEEAMNVTCREVLVSAGEKAGLEAAEINSWLDEGKGGDDVDREVEAASRGGIQGVPNYTVNDRWQVEGAQDTDAFLSLFIRVKASPKGGTFGLL